MPDLYLLCHPTELHKSTNTGQLLPGLSADNTADAVLVPSADSGSVTELSWRCYQICWQRKQADQQLMTALQRGGAVLLFPSTTAEPIDLDSPLPLYLATGTPLQSLIVLDATWQLAQKMFNQSPYLHNLPHWRAYSEYQSVFKLRRNQRPGAWCTAETVALLWQASGAVQQAGQLWQQFHRFNQR